VACHPVTASQGAAAFTHHCEPASLLAAGEALYGSHPQAWLVTVCGAAFDLGERLTPRVAAALPLAVERVRRLITDCLGGGGLNAPSAPDQVERVPQVLP
jgi:Ni,Fe-hydrogenase maturation factor